MAVVKRQLDGPAFIKRTSLSHWPRPFFDQIRFPEFDDGDPIVPNDIDPTDFPFLPNSERKLIVLSPRSRSTGLLRSAPAQPVLAPRIGIGLAGTPLPIVPKEATTTEARDDQFGFEVARGPRGLDDDQCGYYILVRVYLPTNAEIQKRTPTADILLILNFQFMMERDEGPQCDWKRSSDYPRLEVDAVRLDDKEKMSYSSKYDRLYVTDEISLSERRSIEGIEISRPCNCVQYIARFLSIIRDPGGRLQQIPMSGLLDWRIGTRILSGLTYSRDFLTRNHVLYFFGRKRPPCYCPPYPPEDPLQPGEYLYILKVSMWPTGWV
jgi:hypothetical protein